MAAIGDLGGARQRLNWVESLFTVDGHLSEQVTEHPQAPDMVAPWVNALGSSGEAAAVVSRDASGSCGVPGRCERRPLGVGSQRSLPGISPWSRPPMGCRGPPCSGRRWPMASGGRRA